MTAATSLRRPAAGLGLAALSAITGVISYEHGLDVARLVGNGGTVAYLVPLVPDLMIVTSSLTLLEASAARARRPFMSMLALAAGVGWTTAMNVAAGWPHGWGGALVAAGVPVAFVLTFESLLWLFRSGRNVAESYLSGSAASQDEPPDLDADVAWLLGRHSQRSVAALTGAPRARLSKLAGAGAAVAGVAALNGSGPDAS